MVQLAMVDQVELAIGSGGDPILHQAKSKPFEMSKEDLNLQLESFPDILGRWRINHQASAGFKTSFGSLCHRSMDHHVFGTHSAHKKQLARTDYDCVP
jgi:hypothetical protein